MSDGMETLRLLYIAMGPGVAIAVFIYYSDKWDREPRKLVLKSFFLGGLAVLPTYYFEGIAEQVLGIQALQDEHSPLFWPKTIFYAFFGVALAEELCKFLFLKAFVFDEREFNEPFDGIIYGKCAGEGAQYLTGKLLIQTSSDQNTITFKGYDMLYSSKECQEMGNG